MSLSLPSNYPEVDIVRLVNYRTFENCIKNEIRCAIISLMARGITTAAEIASSLGISRTAIYRHLNTLKRNGLIVYRDGRFYVAARLFLVYDVDIDEKGSIRMIIFPNKGGFVDETIGFAFVKGEYCRCDVCIAREKCLTAVKNLAKKLDVKIRSENPLDGFREVVEEITRRDLVKILREGFLIVKLPEEIGEEVSEE
ncbi:MAG: winged helix-turn-helix domain-containing protein [Ignisphaera sp.]